MKRIFSILMLSGLVVVPALQGEKKKPLLPSTVAIKYCGLAGLGSTALRAIWDVPHISDYFAKARVSRRGS